MKTKELIRLGKITNETEVRIFNDDPYPRNLRDYIEYDIARIYVHDGCYGEPKLTPPLKAIAMCNKSPYGAKVILKYDQNWEYGEDNGKAEIHIICPNYEDICSSIECLLINVNI